MESTLDIEQPDQLLAYLRRRNQIEPGEQVTATTLAGGVSNRTVLVERPSGQAWVLKQALEKLRVEADWFSSPARIHREAAGLRALATLLPPDSVPRQVFEDHRHHVLAMEAVPQPHVNWKQLLLQGELCSRHVRRFARMLGTIHARSYDQTETLAPLFQDSSFFESLRLEPYYLYTATQQPDARTFYQELVTETRSRRLALTHGDYSPKNILVRRDPQAGYLVLLDHEVIHWGDPAFDIGFSLTHLLSKAHHIPVHRRAFVQAALLYWQTYAETSGPMLRQGDFAARAARHTLGNLLARIDGRSPLEYLSGPERQRQRSVVLALMANPPTSIPALIHAFAEGIESDARD